MSAQSPQAPQAPLAPSAELDESAVIAIRREKLAALRQAGIAFPNDFKPTHAIAALRSDHQGKTGEELVAQPVAARIAGRMVLRRLMGKAAFADLLGDGARLQLHITREALGEEVFAAFKHWDLGDILGAEGELFKTKTGELTLRVKALRLLTKSLRPLPEKFHGMADAELRLRKRHLDLISDEAVRQRFLERAEAIRLMRQHMNTAGFLEVETPMLHPIPGGANARPFVTHHQALDQPMFLRIAPELYLKRLVTGGFERVYEINRNFRNEGLSPRHNPEFTMMEFYAAYWDHRDLMAFTENLLGDLAQHFPRAQSHQGRALDWRRPFARCTIAEAIAQYGGAEGARIAGDAVALAAALQKPSGQPLALLQAAYFEEFVEPQLWQPVFIMNHPVAISPLARQSDTDAEITERFELYIAGREIANGFSELNDPEEQARRFRAQAAAKEGGDPEAMHYDADYIETLESAMPPTGGCGIGIDRLIMLLTDAANIRDVILFPALRRVA